MHVIDANVFIHGSDLELPFETMLTVPEVTAEIESEEAQRRFEAAEVDLRAPDATHVETVQEAADEAGEDLSEADTRLVALALQFDATLVTDDYGMQNIASRLGIEVEPFLKDGIDDTADWKRVCPNCGQDLDQRQCPVCGIEGKRVSR